MQCVLKLVECRFGTAQAVPNPRPKLYFQQESDVSAMQVPVPYGIDPVLRLFLHELNASVAIAIRRCHGSQCFFGVGDSLVVNRRFLPS